MAELVVAAGVAKGLGIDIGAEVLVKYGPPGLKRVLPKRLRLRNLHFTIVTSFYQRIQYDKAFSAFGEILDDYRKKEFDKTTLLFDSTKFQYTLSITHAQDFGVLSAYDIGDTYSLYDTTATNLNEILASSARIFFWPSVDNVDVKGFESILETSFKFFRTIDAKVMEQMKVGGVGGVRNFFYLSFVLPEIDSRKLTAKIPKDRLFLNNDRVSILIDDSSITSLLTKALK